ncbi:hypothetical protein [Fuerstiella marisgermanici]|nr:hypothetical protein [Fuerstiella marisgermanici]
MTLFEGTAIVHETDGPTEREVVIVHEWTPRPVVVCRYATSGQHAFRGDVRQLNEPITLEIPSLGIQTQARFYDGHSCGDDHRHGLALQKAVEINAGEVMSRIVFHVINCRDFSEDMICHASGACSAGRIEFETNDWQVTLDCVENTSELVESLRHHGGRAITHRVQLSRIDGSTFDNKALDQIASLIEHFIAFVTGTWACLTLPIGYVNDEESWQLWNIRQGRSWSNPYTWSAHLPAKFVKAVFPGFAERFSDEDWNEPFTQAIDWYVQCRNGTTETSIILSQAALELLSWVVYVEIGGVLKGLAGFENLWASDRIRLLLSKMLVMTEFPPKVTDLAEFKFDGNQTYADGPHAITEIRNGITHPKKKKRERLGQMGPVLRHQACELGLFYLECCLLGLSGYFGPFRADTTCGALYSRAAVSEPVYETADFSQLPGVEPAGPNEK